jgi:hypothetical protein
MATVNRELEKKLRSMRKRVLSDIEGAMIRYADDIITLRNQVGALLDHHASKRAEVVDEYCRRIVKGPAR